MITSAGDAPSPVFYWWCEEGHLTKSDPLWQKVTFHVWAWRTFRKRQCKML